jgi:uncharacterized OsmC-like protein
MKRFQRRTARKPNGRQAMTTIPVNARSDPNGRLQLLVGNLQITIDPRDGPSPLELVAASLAASMLNSGREFLTAVGIDNTLKVECSFVMSDAYPDHVSHVFFTVTVPGRLTPGHREALRWTLDHCALHNPLHLDPRAEVTIREAAVSAAA